MCLGWFYVHPLHRSLTSGAGVFTCGEHRSALREKRICAPGTVRVQLPLSIILIDNFSLITEGILIRIVIDGVCWAITPGNIRIITRIISSSSSDCSDRTDELRSREVVDRHQSALVVYLVVKSEG